MNENNYESGAAAMTDAVGPKRFKTLARWTSLVLLVVALGGCGGEQQESEMSEEDMDAAVAQTQEGVREALKATGIAQEEENGGLSVGYEGEGESARMGDNLPAPDWLPAGFPLPGDLSIGLITTDLNGEKNLAGRSAATRDSVYREVEAWAALSGWEMIPANDRVITLVNQTGDVIDAVLEGGDTFSLRLSRRSVASDRQKAAVERTGPGVAAIEVDGKRMEVNGTCRIKGNYHLFEYSSDDGMTYAQLELQQTETETRGSASVHYFETGQFRQLNMNFPMGSGEEPQAQAAGDEFSVRGNFASMSAEGIKGFPGSFSVTCTL